MEYAPGACAEPPAPTSMRLQNNCVKFCASPPSAVMPPVSVMPPASTYLVDIYPRKYVLAGGITLTGGITALGGPAQNFAQLFCSRMLVGEIGRASWRERV